MKDKVILIVDDEQIERDLLSEALETVGYQTKTAVDGQNALDIYNSEKIDLILTDVQMPVMNGLDLVHSIRDINKEVPIIFMTGFDATKASEEVQKQNAAALLIKPFRLLQLQNLIEELLPA